MATRPRSRLRRAGTALTAATAPLLADDAGRAVQDMQLLGAAPTSTWSPARLPMGGGNLNSDLAFTAVPPAVAALPVAGDDCVVLVDHDLLELPTRPPPGTSGTGETAGVRPAPHSIGSARPPARPAHRCPPALCEAGPTLRTLLVWS